jgi:hypothetical protein
LVSFNGDGQISRHISLHFVKNPSPNEIKLNNLDISSQVFVKEKLEVHKKFRRMLKRAYIYIPKSFNVKSK